jgi:uncharacterized protein YdiU (UPF0061 family)
MNAADPGLRGAPPADPKPYTDTAPPLVWRNRFAGLGDGFYTALWADPLPTPDWAVTSDACAKDLGLPDGWWQHPDWRALEVFSGNALWPGMQPLAGVYSGHQFGVWAGQLGDGRALLLGEVQTPTGGLEIQLKGAGLTPYSRMGDGRAVLRSSIREFVCSEAMHGLGIPTTRALCLTASPLPVRRETVETAAVLTRVAPSFVRFGHFEHFAHHGQHDRLRQLLDHVVAAHFPDCATAANPAVALLAEVTARTAVLIAQWQAVGFCHGVMNTDNMSILGLTIDYGPFGFLDAFDPGHICNHSDPGGRYAFARQPGIALWNLQALAQALVPVAAGDIAGLRAALMAYEPAFNAALLARLRDKLGLSTPRDDDPDLINDWLALLAEGRVDHTIAWRRLCDFDATPGEGAAAANAATNAPIRDLFIARDAFDAWAARYARRLRDEAGVAAERARRMKRVNPKYILRNHLAEEAIRRARDGDFSETQRLLKVLARPYDEQPEHSAYAGFPPDWAQHLEVSCSS